MIEDTKPIAFLFFTGTLDVVLTIITVMSGLGVEVNPIVNWISPDWMMCTTMVIGFSTLCLILIPVYKKYSRIYPVKTMLYSWGSIHIAGAFSSVVVFMRVML